uniref:Tetratricopeptide repeat domain 12 n=2 Tax=Podarcis muralis TaxID=64176 RepID=A0A670KKF7_PODMU|nr:tetratricopeptide repeat protein 12 isoform X1 [Podarcis muralis]XP_028563955.1 tetratricopeptide repeat protein 12 isoform X1 [Podarcis muralis]XP_028563956.1 tetratricopeptide repeat protein 12 isoform X1 [Podarcis muralis]XP_028563957.1 tetratricopeptide repeat protein 12 isoform X1 [Podarcis muralis]
MSKAQEEQDLQKFLRDVDEVTNLIQGLNSTDPSIQEKAIADTEKRLNSTAVKCEDKHKPTVDRTCINTRAPDLPDQQETMNPESFMAVLEKDAKERARKRKHNEALANALKEKGNDAFSKGDYALAIQKYTEGLKKQKDMQVLYTNRAQAYIKLQDYEKAISDCDWALRCDEKCIKALFHMGKAYLAQKQYSKSRECYLKILDIDPGKEKLCKDYIHQVDLEEKKQHEEERAMEELESGKHTAVSVKELLQKLRIPDENILYYADGIRLLTALMQDCTEQALFRTNNGFSIINDNAVVQRVFHTKTKSPDEVELFISILLLWQAACKDNEENQRLLLTHPDVNLQLPSLLLSEVPEIQEECLALLSLYAETENGRILLVRHLDTTRWLHIFMSFIKVFDSRARCALKLLTSLVPEEKFKIQCRIKLSTEALPLFIELLSSAETLNELGLAHCIAIMGDICSDVVIRMQMTESPDCWQACLSFLDECWNKGKATRYPECLYALLGLMMNLSLEPNLLLQDLAIEISGKCMSLFDCKEGRIVTRAVGLLSHILPISPEAREEVIKDGVVRKMIRFLKADGQITHGYAMKILAVCAKSSQEAQEEIVKLDKKCKILLKFLRSENEVLAGNAAFCLGRCFEVPGAATNLLDVDIVRILLKVAGRDAQRTSAQENAAIALGKLCTADARHTSRLRELNGMAVLNTSLKHMQGF